MFRASRAAHPDIALILVDEASLKGGQRALVLMDGMAYVVDMRDRTVVNLENRNRLAGLGDLRVDAVVEAKS